MKITVDGREVERFEQTLARAVGGSAKDIEAIVKKGALNIKTDSARRIKGLAHARAYPNSITFDVGRNMTGWFADIGPDHARRQGPLGNILEYGTVNNPPHPHLRPAAEAEQPRFEKALEDAAVRALGIEP